MNHIQAFEERLRSLFQAKATEFKEYAEEETSTALVASQIAGMYQDLVESLSH